MSRTIVLMSAVVVFTQAGCLAAAAGYAGARLAQSDDVYVCQDAPNALSIQEVGSMVEADEDSWTSRAGDQVSVQQQRTLDLEVDGDEQRMTFAYVESENVDRAYWIPVDALCSGS